MVEKLSWPNLYPIFLRLEDWPVLVVGAGNVGVRKIEGLLRAGARVTVIAPEAEKPVQKLASGGKLTWRQKEFEPSDVKGFGLVFAATSSREVNEAVALASRGAGALVNVADTPDLCSFTLPSVVDRSPLKIAVSTAGACPAYAREIRQRLERLLEPDSGEFVALLGRMREKARQNDPETVGEMSRALVESPAEEMWLRGEREKAREILEALVEVE